MIFEIPGIWVHNRGALLMLEAIRDRLARAYPDAKLAVPVVMPSEHRHLLGVLGVLPKGDRLIDRLKSLLPALALRSRALVKQSSVDVILDASGFGYGDFWGKTILERRLIDRLQGWRRRRRVSILLPQALGPFTMPGMSDAFRRAVELQDLIFVRDEVSLRHVHAIVPNATNVQSAPDFTNLLHPKLPAELRHWAGWSFVVPNEKMVAGDRAASHADYVAFMGSAITALLTSGRRVALLVHEGAKDKDLAKEINAGLPQPVPIIDQESALDTKAMIAAADLLISSRFHGLVSGLSNAVPSLACGWSHKYAELMRDYGLADMSIDIDRREDWAMKLAEFIRCANDPDFRRHLAKHSETQRKLSEAMWQRCFDTIERVTGQRANV